MATLEKAVELAARAHAGQTDREGLPYLLHPLRVMARVGGGTAGGSAGDLDAQTVAVLHDAVEDSDLSHDDLRAAGFSEAVLAAAGRLTHADGTPYAEYVVGCAADPLARRVKLADLEDNMLPRRTLMRPDREPADLARLRRYVLSYQFLSGDLSEADYRARMDAAEEAGAPPTGG